jgi:hypothetical protein
VGDIGERAGHLRRGGGVIDENGAGSHAGERPQFAEGDTAQIVVVADAGEDEVGFARRRGRRVGQAPAEFLRPSFGLAARAVVDGDLVARPDEVARHREAHDAETDECRTHAHARLLPLRRDALGATPSPRRQPSIASRARHVASSGASNNASSTITGSAR